MDQQAMTFIPAVLVARVGQPVRFLNSDTTVHNINVKETATKSQVFNVAPPPGASYDHAFERAGFYGVSRFH